MNKKISRSPVCGIGGGRLGFEPGTNGDVTIRSRNHLFFSNYLAESIPTQTLTCYHENTRVGDVRTIGRGRRRNAKHKGKYALEKI